MLLVRRIATGLVVVAALAVLSISLFTLWSALHWHDLPLTTAFASGIDARAQDLQQKMGVYNRRLSEMELVVVILLGITGIYTLVFILTADLNARSVSRLVDRAMSNVKDQITMSMGELRALKDETAEVLRDHVKDATERLGRIQEQVREMIQAVHAQAVLPVPAEMSRDLDTIHERISAMTDSRPTEEQLQEVMHYEGALPALELLHSRQLAPQLAQIYRGLARYYNAKDATRARFYLSRAVAMAPDDFETANELGWLALDGLQSPDYRLARKHFETSLAAQPGQQRAKYGLAQIAKAAGDLETAQGLLESAVQSDNWETRPDPRNAALVHYALACVLARRGQDAAAGYKAQYLIRATQQLQDAFACSSRRLEQMLSRDTEEGGDLFVLANTPPYEHAVNDLLLSLSVGAA